MRPKTGSPMQFDTGGRSLAGSLRRIGRDGASLGAFLVLYVALDWVSVIEPFGELGITPWNPPAGLIFAVFLLYGARALLPVFVAVTLADVLLRGVSTTPSATVASAVVISLSYGWSGLLLRDKIGFSVRLNNRHDLLWLLAATLGTTVFIAVVVVWIFCTSGLVPWAEFPTVTLHYWTGDVIGITVLTPFILLLFDRERRQAAVRDWTVVEAGLQLAAIALGLWIIFGLERIQHFEFSYVLFLPLIWIALRHGLMGATWGIVATQLGLIVAIQMRGYDAHIVTQFQLLMLAVTVSGLFLGAVVDERRRAEASLRGSEARLQTVIGTAPDAIFMLEGDLTIVSANVAAERMFGFRASAAGRIDFRALLPDLQITAVGGDIVGIETTARRIDGTSFVAEVAVGKARIDSRSVYVAVLRDASPRRQAEQWRKEHEAELAHAMRLTTTGEMAAAMAHELNQPLTAVIGFARACQGLLQAPGEDREAAHRAAIDLIENAVQQASRAGRIIRSTREFLKRDDMQFVKVTVGEMVQAVLDLVRAEAVQHGVQIVTRVDSGLPPVFVDPIQIEQVILNLLRNSIDAMVQADSKVRQITLSAERAPGDDGHAEIEVRDSGPGFAAEVADRLFQPFSTTKGGGMGLGLSISRSIIEGHGGRIWASSDGGGAAIRFTLPLDTDADAETT